MVRRATLTAVGVMLTMVMPLGAPSFAQQSGAQQPGIPPSAEPGAIDLPTPPDAPISVPPVQGVAPVDAVAPEGAEAIRFVLRGIDVQGNTALDDSALSDVYADLVGQTVSLADVYGIANRISLRYREAGYILAQAVVPPQEIADGVVAVRVVEGFIDQVDVRGPDGEVSTSYPRVASYGSSISNSRPLTQRDLERYLLLANDLPGFQVRAILAASPIQPGAADLTLVVEEKRLDGFIAADNRGTRYIGPFRTTAGATLNNVTGNNERIGVVAATTPGDANELQYISGAVDLPIWNDGLVLRGSVSHSRTRPGSSLRQFGIEGRTTSWSVGADYPLVRSREANLTIGARFDYSDSQNQFDPQFRLLNYTDRLRVVRARVDGDLLDSYRGLSSMAIEVSQGVDIFNATISDTGVSRAGGRGDFTKATLDLSRLQSLGGGFSLYAAARGQIAGDVLLASEEFAIGGARFGRAYDPSEITGDSGVAGSLEARYSADVSGFDALDSLQLYAFYDIGVAEKRGAPSQSGASAGAGIRFGLFETVSGSIEFAQPLTRDVAAENNRDGRVFFTLAAQF